MMLSVYFDIYDTHRFLGLSVFNCWVFDSRFGLLLLLWILLLNGGVCGGL